MLLCKHFGVPLSELRIFSVEINYWNDHVFTPFTRVYTRDRPDFHKAIPFDSSTIIHHQFWYIWLWLILVSGVQDQLSEGLGKVSDGVLFVHLVCFRGFEHFVYFVCFVSFVLFVGFVCFEICVPFVGVVRFVSFYMFCTFCTFCPKSIPKLFQNYPKILQISIHKVPKKYL